MSKDQAVRKNSLDNSSRRNTASEGYHTPNGKYRGPSPVIMPRWSSRPLAPFLRDPKLLPKKPPIVVKADEDAEEQK
jgi:hypothetical protein